MRFSYLTLADAASQGPDGKLNALGMGIRQYFPPSLPIRGRLVVLAGVEASLEELGDYPLSISVRSPTGRRQTLIEDTIQATKPPDADERLPIVLSINAGVVFEMEEEGRHELQVRIGKARAKYPFVVMVRESDQP